MVRNVAAAIIVAILMAATAAAQPNPCTLLTAAEVTSALGSAPSGGESKASTERGATSRTCTEQVGQATLSINIVEFASAAAADQGMTLVLMQSQEIPEWKLEPAPGVGDRSAFGMAPIGAQWLAIKGKYMLGITVIGATNPPQLREPVKRLTAAGLAKLAP